MDKKKKILAFDLPPTAKVGISVTKNWKRENSDHDIFEAHRDKQFILIILQHGNFKIMLDFEEHTIVAPAILLIFPDQVRQLMEANEYEVFSIDFIPPLISADLQSLLYRTLLNNPVLNKNKDLQQQLDVICNLMYQVYLGVSNTYTSQSIQALLVAMLTLIAGTYARIDYSPVKENRTSLIEQQFRSLLNSGYKQWKKPSQYAVALSISVSHLNDSVREITGSSVSDQIQKHVILEAKRLLFLSKFNVKEISFELGFDDPVYFNRLFKKVASITPMQFRQKFRE